MLAEKFTKQKFSEFLYSLFSSPSITELYIVLARLIWDLIFSLLPILVLDVLARLVWEVILFAILSCAEPGTAQPQLVPISNAEIILH